MRLTTVWVAFAVVAMALAGCAEEGGSQDEDDETFQGVGELEATEDTGVIRGVVVDQAIVPIPNASVSVKDQGLNTTTTATGAFGFAGLDPGTYIVEASKPGFQKTQASVEVVAGDDKPPVVKILLDPDPSTRPFVEPVYLQGFIACSFTLALVSFAACGVDGVDTATNNEFILVHTFDRKADFVQSEMVWDSTQTLGDSMSVSWTDPSSGTQVGINGSAGPSPQIVTFDNKTFEEMELVGKDLWLRVFSTAREGTDVAEEETWNGPYRDTVYPTYNGTAPDPVKDTVDDTLTGCNPVACTLNPVREDCVGWAVLFDACMGVGGVGATLQQNYEIFTHVFYNLKPEGDWTFGEDGDYPVPDS